MLFYLFSAKWTGPRGMSESYIEPIAQLQELQQSQQQLLLDPESIPDANAEQSWMELRDSLEELNGLMKDFGQLVHVSMLFYFQIFIILRHTVMIYYHFYVCLITLFFITIDRNEEGCMTAVRYKEFLHNLVR